jgi:peptide/nickel transport system permease protein
MLPLRYAAGRIASSLLTLFVVSVLIFTAIHLIPGRYEDIVLSPFAPPASRAALAERLGLNKPLPEQYGRWLLAAGRADFGLSLTTGRPIADEFARRAPITLQLTLMSAVLSILFGVPLGIVAGLSAGKRARAVGRLSGALAMSVPDFVLGSFLVYLFSRYALGLTVGGYVPLFADPLTNLRAMILPAVALSVFGLALIMRTTRDAVMNVLSEPYVVSAVARGETVRQIIRRHVLRNASIPIVTVIATNVGYLLGGAVIIELLFSIPGLGRYMLDAISNRDYPVVQAGVLLASFVFVAINTFADLAYAWLDPRIGARNR